MIGISDSSDEKRNDEENTLVTTAPQPTASAIVVAVSSNNIEHATFSRLDREHQEEPNAVVPPHNSNPYNVWRHLPADMIFTIASCLDGRTLARLERVDKFTHFAVANRSIVLWRALAEKAEWKTGWMLAVERDQLIKLQTSCTTAKQRQDHPKQYFLERAKLIQGFHRRLLVAQQNRLRSAPFKQRAQALRWYDEAILPVLLFILFLLFVIFLIYQLQMNDGLVTWMTVTPLMIFFGLITLSTCFLCFIRCRGHRDSPIMNREYDTEHFIPNDYARESNSFMSLFINLLIHPIGSTRRRVPVPIEKLVQRLGFAALIMLGLLSTIVFVSLRVTSAVDWPWPLIFTPFFISIGLIPCIACFRTSPGQSVALSLGLLFFSSPIITFIVLLTVYLNNGGSTSSLHLQYVFIPLYIIDAITFFYTCGPAIALLIGWLYLQCRGGLDAEHFPLINVLASMGWILGIGPFFYLKVVLGLRADCGEKIMSNLALFLPLLLPVLILICGAIYFILFHCSDLLDRAEKIEEESRLAREERKVPLTVEEIGNDESFVLAIIEEPPVDARMVAH